jgi:hypothetical protein
MKFLAVILLAMSAVACTPNYQDDTGKYSVLPAELKDCKFYYVGGSDGSRITVVRCPNSETTTQMGTKSKHTTVTN